MNRGNYQDTEGPAPTVPGDDLDLGPEPESPAARFAAAFYEGAKLGVPLAEAARLARRNLERDDRVSCAAECAHYRHGRCGNHRAARLASREVGRELAGLLQRCPGFNEGG